MKFAQVDEGNYRIYAGTIESHSGREGYRASIVIVRLQNGQRHEALRDLDMCGGYCWPSPTEALDYAVGEALRIVRSQTLETW